MLIDVLNRVSEDSGIHAVQQRTKLEKLLNAAAREIYYELECSRIYREISCLVGGNKIIALPTFIGELRGMRKHTADTNFPLETMTPRYASNTLAYKWNNWRDLGQSPIHTTPSTVDVLTFTASVVEDAVVTINGKTNTSARTAESVTIDASPKYTTALFDPAIKSISSVSARTCDITIKDADGNEIAVLYNNENNTRYKMVDVSELYYGVDSAAGETLVDILYKEPLYVLTNDSDSFPAGDQYDDAWHARAMAIHYNPMQGRKDDANRYRMQSLILIKNIKDGVEHGETKRVEFGRNKFMNRYMYGQFTGDVVDCWSDEL